MDDSWSWDGSVISLTSSFPSPASSSTTPSPLARTRVPSARSLQESGELDAPPEPASPPADSAAFGTTPTAPPPPLVEPPRPSSPTSLSSPTPSTTSSAPVDIPPPLEPHKDHSHPLASFLLAEHSLGFSPPSSPAASTTSSFPGSRARLSSAGGAPRGRGRGRGRTGSVSSTASTDGSAHEGESLASGGVSSGEDEHDHDGAGGAGGLVMPSMHLGGASSAREGQQRPVIRCPDEGASGRKSKVLVLGKTADERRTLATLLSHDEDLRRAMSTSSVAGATDLSYSFLSMRPSERSHSSTRSEPVEKGSSSPPPSSLASFELISPVSTSSSSPSFAFVDLYQPSTEIDDEAARLGSELVRPLEQLEAKVNRSYPSTTGLFGLVEKVGCGEFDAAFFLFSSPPTAAEIVLARPLSHLIPLYPILILPASPTGKPQKTYALEQAVQEQLEKAGVRWVRRLPHKDCEGRKGPRAELSLLPHDLFVHHPPAHAHSTVPSTFPTAPASATSSSSSGGEGVSAPTSAGSTQASSPATEDAPRTRSGGPTSLTASQELPSGPTTPHSPALTGVSSSFRSLSSSFTGASLPSSSSSARSASLASSRSSSHHRRTSSRHRSRSHRDQHRQQEQRNSTSLHSLYALQALIHSPSAPAELRRERARQFIEWREVEVAARGARVGAVEDLPREWEEKAMRSKGEDEQGGGRREIDFSKRVAERRRALGAGGVAAASRAEKVEHDDDDVLASSSDEDEGDEEAEDDPSAGHSYVGGTARNSFSYSYTSAASMDPTTPRVSHRPLAAFSAFDDAGVDPAASSSNGTGSGYFPPFPPPPSSDDAPHLSASFTSSSGSGGTFSTFSGPSSAMAASSILLLPLAASDPFHLPSLLHLVGLNLRLAVFSPSFSAAQSPHASAMWEWQDAQREQREGEPRREREKGAGGRGKVGGGWGTWIGAAAVVGLVFAAGVAVGAQAGDGGSLGGQERWWALFGRC
ncbi:hypothetical protein JCM6882_007515 [Rhodosporidiobolus microsporus]